MDFIINKNVNKNISETGNSLACLYLWRAIPVRTPPVKAHRSTVVFDPKCFRQLYGRMRPLFADSSVVIADPKCFDNCLAARGLQLLTVS